MKKSLIAFAAFAAAALIALVGCETEKLSDTQLSISPSSATVSPGKSVVLTAKGGWDYTWKVQGSGTLSSYNGKQVTYTASGTTYTPSTPSNSTTNTTYRVLATNKAEESETTSTAVVSVFSGGHEATATITIKGE